MATRVIYAGEEDNAIVSGANATYSVARAMTSPILGTVTDTHISATIAANAGYGAGQTFISAVYEVVQAFVAFDTTGLSGLSSATLALANDTASPTATVSLEARIYDWGVAVALGDEVPGASLSAKTLVATSSVSGGGSTGVYINWSDVALLANINTSGKTSLILNDAAQTSGTAPASGAFSCASFFSADSTTAPKLTIIDTSTQSSQTLSGGATSFTPTVTGLHDLDMWGGGAKTATTTGAKSGAGGGAYTFGQYMVTSLSAVTVGVAATQTVNSTQGNDTYFHSNSFPDPLARGGHTATATGTNAGGTTSSGQGAVQFAGGSGTAAQSGGGSRGGSGGGSGAGTAAVGTNGTVGSGAAGGAGATAPTGGGNGGTGGAGGGGAGVAGSVPGGGGGGGGSSSGANGDGAAGKMIVYWYVYPATKAFPAFTSPRKFFQKRAR